MRSSKQAVRVLIKKELENELADDCHRSAHRCRHLVPDAPPVAVEQGRLTLMASAAAHHLRFRLLPAVEWSACMRLACGVMATLVVAAHPATAAPPAQAAPASGAAVYSLKPKLSDVEALEDH